MRISFKKTFMMFVIIASLMSLSITAFAYSESEPNNGFSSADTAGSSNGGTLTQTSDVNDYWKFTLRSDENHFIVGLTAQYDDLDLYVYDSSYNLVGSSTSSISNESVSKTVLPGGTYYIRVKGYSFEVPQIDYSLMVYTSYN